MEITRKRIRRDFAPINAAVSLICMSSGSPVTQVYDSTSEDSNSVYQPNRAITATILMPLVTLNANDGSLKTPYGNVNLAEIKWYVNNVDITTSKEWDGYYSIRTDGSYRGAIVISKNVDVSKQYAFRFEGKVYDKRLNVNIPISTDDIILSTTDKSMDQFSLAIDESNAFLYNPFNDKLLEYDYKVAHGKTTETEQERTSCTDVNSYLKVINLHLYCGKQEYTKEYSIKLYDVSSDGTETELTTDDSSNEAVEISKDHVTIDVRMVSKSDYRIKAFVSGREVGKNSFSINRYYQTYTVEPSNSSDLNATATDYYSEAMVSSNGNVVKYAANILKLLWKTDTSSHTGMIHNEGGAALFNAEEAGLGDSYDKNWMDVYIESTQKEAYSAAIDESGNQLVDENGNQIIFN